MKVALLGLLGVTTQAAVIQRSTNGGLKNQQLESRQLEGLIPGVLSALLPTLQPASRDKVTPQFRPEATREIIRYGPLTVFGTKSGKQGSYLDPAGTDFTQILAGLCTDCTVLSGATSLTFENKSTAMLTSGVYNHHVFIADVGKPQKIDMGFECTAAQQSALSGLSGLPGLSGLLAGSTPPGQSTSGQSTSGSGMSGVMPNLPSIPIGQLFGSGHDDTSIDFAIKNNSLNTGYYVPKGDTLFQFTTLVNYRPENQNVYLTIDMEYLPGKPKGYLDAGITAMTATGCAGIMYIPPKNQSSTMRGSAMTIQTPGYVFDIKAHLHDGGTSVRLLLNDKPVCTSEAIYGGAAGAIEVGGAQWDTIQGYTKCSNPIRVEKGDKLLLEANYDTAAHPLRPGAMSEMGSMGGVGEAMGMASVVYARDDVSAA